MSPKLSVSGKRRDAQRGVVLFVALIVLVIMTLAGLAMLRQMGAGASVVGNVAFKENTTSVADLGVETARQWILDNKNALSLDAPVAGYYSSWSASVDPSTFHWEDAFSVVVPAGVLPDGIQEIRYNIYRLCETPNMGALDAGQHCSDGTGNFSGTSTTGGNYTTPNFIELPGPYYRVTARVIGPRHTFSYVQVLMN